jgi:TRAP-type mannitol/chloroaromatic compound transport system permease small subunit
MTLIVLLLVLIAFVAAYVWVNWPYIEQIWKDL